MMLDERTARMALCALGHLGAPKLTRLVEEEGPADVWQALLQRGEESMWARRARAIDPAQIERETARCGARFLIPGDEEWPAGLDDLITAEVGEQTGRPFGLWVRGAPLPDLTGGVAIVGARAATHYGQNVALELAADLAAEGRSVVSGLAYGIDSAAHRGALSVSGHTVAAVAGGVDRPYPVGNLALAGMIMRDGAVISELPPGHQPTRPAFLARNRLIAALTGGLVVVEAALRSGARNSAAWASELGRVLMAVPGPITAATSQTPHLLIRDGQAVLVAEARDVRELLSPLGAVPDSRRRDDATPLDRLPAELRDVREAIRAGEEVGAAVLAARTGLAVTACLSALGELGELGWVEQGDEGGWRLPGRCVPQVS